MDRADVNAALAGIFDVNTKLDHIMDDPDAIRAFLEDDDGEEEQEPEDT